MKYQLDYYYHYAHLDDGDGEEGEGEEGDTEEDGGEAHASNVGEDEEESCYKPGQDQPS